MTERIASDSPTADPGAPTTVRTNPTAGVWRLDARISTASFTAHQLWMNIQGTIPFRSGQAEMGPNGQLLGATAELDLTAIDTGNARRERDLARPTLLDIASHPTLTVRIGAGRPTATGWIAPATLGVRGRRCPVELTIRLDEPGPDGEYRVVLRTELDRTPLGMRAPRFIIGRRVQIEVEAVLQRS